MVCFEVNFLVTDRLLLPMFLVINLPQSGEDLERKRFQRIIISPFTCPGGRDKSSRVGAGCYITNKNI
jgi:hypothetical protein